MKTHINTKYLELEGFIKAIPELFSDFREIIQDSRNIIKVVRVNGILLNIKSFKIPHPINRIAYKYFRKSKAERSYKYAERLLKKGINTPEPVAFIEISESGLFDSSYYISIHEEVDGTIKDIYNQPIINSTELLREFTSFTVKLHEKGIYHKDYSPGNILYKRTETGYDFYLVDLNRIRFTRLNLFDCCKSFSRIRLDRETLRFIAIEYSQRRSYNIYICDFLINYFNKMFWKKYLHRHTHVMHSR